MDPTKEVVMERLEKVREYWELQHEKRLNEELTERLYPSSGVRARDAKKIHQTLREYDEFREFGKDKQRQDDLSDHLVRLWSDIQNRGPIRGQAVRKKNVEIEANKYVIPKSLSRPR